MYTSKDFNDKIQQDKIVGNYKVQESKLEMH